MLIVSFCFVYILLLVVSLVGLFACSCFCRGFTCFVFCLLCIVVLVVVLLHFGLGFLCFAVFLLCFV